MADETRGWYVCRWNIWARNICCILHWRLVRPSCFSEDETVGFGDFYATFPDLWLWAKSLNNRWMDCKEICPIRMHMNKLLQYHIPIGLSCSLCYHLVVVSSRRWWSDELQVCDAGDPAHHENHIQPLNTHRHNRTGSTGRKTSICPEFVMNCSFY